MSSAGYGLNGGRPRCFVFFQEFQKCYASADEPQQCINQKEDYMECLHRKKEIARAKEIKAHFLQKQAKEAKDKRDFAERATNGVIIGLGLVEEDK